MFTEGVDLMFVSGGNLEQSVIDAATDKRCKVICSDTDKRHVSTVVLTSAVKDISSSVKSVLHSIYVTKDFERAYGGKVTYSGAGLATFVVNDVNGDAFDRFSKFTKAEYEKIQLKLNSGEITVKRDIQTENREGYATAEELINGLGLEGMTVNVIQ